MMMDGSEDRMDERLRRAATEYNSPPATPRAEMWERIQAARRSGAPVRDTDTIHLPLRRVWSRPAVRLLAGLAAMLVLGIGLGRLTVPRPGGTATVADTPDPTVTRATRPGANLATAITTAQHFSRVETFLTEFNTRLGDSTFSREAKALLTTTRLLLDSRRVTDTRTRRLLDDLEFVLVQIATLDPRNRPQDLDAITEDLTHNHLRTRLRNAMPADPAIRM